MPLVNSESQDPLPPDSAYRVLSMPFTFDAVADNPFGIAAGDSQAVADGYWILLPPLSPGKHTIHFRGVLPLPEFAFTFETEVTYYISRSITQTAERRQRHGPVSANSTNFQS